jgi:hypothetical protein
MALAARKVLDDCSIALEMMENETDPDRLRVLWIGSMALIRLVGHVLRETDGKNPLYRDAIDRHWEYLQNSGDPTFHQFIKASRDRAVKRYEIDFRSEPNITLAIQRKDGSLDTFELEDCIFMPLEAGWRTGSDARDVYRDAIDWWDHDLEEIEKGSNANQSR